MKGRKGTRRWPLSLRLFLIVLVVFQLQITNQLFVRMMRLGSGGDLGGGLTNVTKMAFQATGAEKAQRQRKPRRPIMHPEWHPRNRTDRFPSVDERVRLYMSTWYHPPCEEDDKFSFQFFQGGFDKGDNDLVPAPHVALYIPPLIPMQSNNRTVEIPGVIRPDKPILIDDALVHDCSRLPKYATEFFPATSDRVFRRGNLWCYCQDSFDMVDVMMQQQSQTQQRVPLLAKYGDAPYLSPFPHFHKFRIAATPAELQDLLDNNNHDCVSTRRTLHDHLYPILWKLNSIRHWVYLDVTEPFDRPWSDKKNAAVWRGGMNGPHVDYSRFPNDLERCRANKRCAFVWNHRNSTIVDAALTETLGYIAGPRLGEENVTVVKPRIHNKAILEFKVLVVFEGNDVASGLKWNLLSNSVVLMPKPTKSSWAMEELLEPWVHYIPIQPDGGDAEEKARWVFDHDEDAQKIAERATLWMEDMVYGSEAIRDDRLVKEEMMRRYRAHFRPAG